MYSKLITLFLITFLIASTNAQDVRGIWYWTWSSSVNVGSTNLGVAFSGWTDPGQAMGAASGVVNSLQGDKYISLGGGNDNGAWHASNLQSVTSYCQNHQFTGFNGIAFDIEEGDSGLGAQFVSTFRACKSSGYKVLVTISHSNPYGIADGASVMSAFFGATDAIDYMSPQLYSSGTESANDYTALGVAWSSYQPFSGKLIPSIVSANLYSDAQNYFAGIGITTVGYVQWSQTASTGPAPPNTPPASSGSSSGSTVRCGASWTAANSACGNTCTVDGDCPSGQQCYNALAACSGSPPPSAPVTPPPSAPPSGSGSSTVRCGASWTDASGSCQKDCATNADCPSGTYCYNALAACSGNPPPSAPVTPPPSGSGPVRCGTSWGAANAACGAPCTDDSQCNGQQCWAALSLAPCGGSNAVAENSNVFAETTPVNGQSLSPLAIGLIAGGCVLFVVLVAVVVVVVSKSKAEEKV